MNFLKKLNYFKPKATIILLFLLSSLALAPIHTPKAHALWGEFPQQIFDDAMEYVENIMKGIGMGSLKQTAIVSINAELESIIGGSSSEAAKFITDWQFFLVVQPKETANIAMNDYLSQTISQGRSSISGYASAASANLLADNYEGFGKGSFSYGLAMNNPSYGKFSYFAQADSDFDAYSSAASGTFGFEEMAKAHTTERKDPTITYHGEDITDASNNFGNLQLSNFGINNQWNYDTHIREKYAELLETEQNKATTKAISNESFAQVGDLVSTPGILIKDAMANAQDIGNKILAAAENPGEVISAVVQSMLTKAIQNGIGQAGSIARKTIQTTQNKAMSEFNAQAARSGVGSLFKN